jgi:aspartyl-tRNA(Asn)/glutamyl-tRNA(Gln) amidotransferase subunit B
MLSGEGSPRRVAEARDLLQISDSEAIAAAVEAVLAEHPEEAARLAAGEDRLLGFLVGKVMRSTGGRADPKLVSSLIRKRTGG